MKGAGMTNQELAENLRDAERDGDTENIVYYENEILARLDVPLKDTEQGLTRAAADAIEAFCNDHALASDVTIYGAGSQ